MVAAGRRGPIGYPSAVRFPVSRRSPAPLAAAHSSGAAACSIRARIHTAAGGSPRDPGLSVCVLFFDGLSDEAFSASSPRARCRT